MSSSDDAGPAGGDAGTSVRIGTADARVPKRVRDRFPEAPSLLGRYAAVFDAVELNRTFYALPRTSTFARWAETVPPGFRFSVKVPREITHRRRLVDADEPLAAFVAATDALGDRRGPLLIQLPPSLAFDAGIVDRFLAALRVLVPGPDALEPRHESWFAAEAEELLRSWKVARVAADPPRAEGDGLPAGCPDLAYFRLHGSPRIYYSEYEAGSLRLWAERIRQARATAREVWCIFDNTALDAATGDALALRELLRA